MKTCNKCNIEKLDTEFYKGRNDCKICNNAINRAYKKANREKINQYLKNKYITNEEFKSKRLDINKKYRNNNKETLREKDKQYYKSHKAQHAAKNGKRRAAKLERTPKYANLEIIKNFYKLAELLTKETGIEHHVDHIIPLQGETVSGFHVETNLQVIPAFDNLVKGTQLEYGISGLCPTGVCI